MTQGTWYTLSDTCATLNITISELHGLIDQQKLSPIIFTKARSFLLFTPNNNEWGGHAVCTYRGPLGVHARVIEQLMDGDSASIGSGYGRLLDERGIQSWQSDYPFKKTLPHKPLTAWKPMQQGAMPLSHFAATLYPTEGVTARTQMTKSLKVFTESMKKLQESQETGKPYSAPSFDLPGDNDLALIFDAPAFESDSLRIPFSDIKALQTGTTLPLIGSDDGPRINKRENQLHSLIGRILESNPKISASHAWKLISQEVDADEPVYDIDCILRLVDADCIEWVSRNGNGQAMTWGSFQTKLSRLKKAKAAQSS